MTAPEPSTLTRSLSTFPTPRASAQRRSALELQPRNRRSRHRTAPPCLSSAQRDILHSFKSHR